MKHILFIFFLMTSYMSLAQLTVDVTAEGEFPTNIRPIRVIFDFNQNVQGFTIDDITVSNAILDDFRVDISDRQYSVAVNPTNPIGLDTIRVSVGANVATVLGGTEGNEPSNVLEFLFDGKSPAILAVNAPDTIFSMEPYTVQ
ncbi:MAG: Ig-like domain-containing protein, partial [Cytophagales bacterium]|nr:Ig-like domain-containing protein [Cytophagales bacterium]